MRAVVVENYNSIDGISIKEISQPGIRGRRSPRPDRRRRHRLCRRPEGAGTLSDQGPAAVRAGHRIRRRRRCRRRRCRYVQVGHVRDRHDPFRRARRVHLGALGGAESFARAGCRGSRRVVPGQLSDRALLTGRARLHSRRRNPSGAGRCGRRRHRGGPTRKTSGRAGDCCRFDAREARIRGWFWRG